MKFSKFTFITVAVTLALAQRASAGSLSPFVGTTTQFSKLNIGLIVMTNKPSVEKGNSTVTAIGKGKIDNKALLQLFATWSGHSLTNWQSFGAQWIYDWDTGEPAIADRTGTNILLFVGSDNTVTNGTSTSFFDIDWFDELGPDSRTFMNVDPGSDNFTDNFDLALMQLLHTDTDDSSGDYNIISNGPKVEHYIQHWDGAHTFTTWTDTENFKPAGSGELINGVDFGAVDGSISANGHGTGFNDFIYAP